ncbi:hypothetical protein V0U79_12195 [Hyphobacterium sp. HN65]|uniref:Uncharacterized protein n=1 Tax=Hyphobacterium lacteum TaxID=3116575 RepID=A0ABU7LUY0_9PROT|nr:hypothetical protein [Hyphobacterium sp. HN65]MEE2527129.1 hypothetical protein [Hyphobacterium sp. HN65]
MKFTFGIIALGLLTTSPPAFAQDSAAASGDSAEGSALLTGELVESGIPVALGSAVLLAGGTIALATGEIVYLEEGAELGADIMSFGFEQAGPLFVSDEVIVAAPPAPDVPFEPADDPLQPGGKPQ